MGSTWKPTIEIQQGAGCLPDEYVAFMDMLGKESVKVIDKLKQIVMLGRQAGFFLVLACQRPDAKYLGDGIRDQCATCF